MDPCTHMHPDSLLLLAHGPAQYQPAQLTFGPAGWPFPLCCLAVGSKLKPLLLSALLDMAESLVGAVSAAVGVVGAGDAAAGAGAGRPALGSVMGLSRPSMTSPSFCVRSSSAGGLHASHGQNTLSRDGNNFWIILAGRLQVTACQEASMALLLPGNCWQLAEKS